jgi:hypothetical protein
MNTYFWVYRCLVEHILSIHLVQDNLLSLTLTLDSKTPSILGTLDLWNTLQGSKGLQDPMDILLEVKGCQDMLVVLQLDL